MHIWVDADACPRAVKEIVFRAIQRRNIHCTLVANSSQWVPKSPNISTLSVPKIFDEADNAIATRVEPGDLVITADIPLAARVIEKGAYALDPRGRLHTRETIGERLSLRNFMADLRAGGVETSGPAPLGKRDSMAFANSLDALLTRLQLAERETAAREKGP